MPVNSTASLQDPAAKTTDLVADLAGDYTVELSVSLRSERSGQAADRHYVVKLLVWDCSGDYEF
jgi:hypothetical protein